MSVIDELKKLEDKAKELRNQAKKEALAGVKAAMATLNSLGYSYGLVENPRVGKDGPFPKKRGRPAAKVTRQRDPNKKCPVCGETGHDARRHRWDAAKKKK